MPQAKPTRYAVLFVLSTLGLVAFTGFSPVHAPITGPPTYTLTPFPFITQEGLSMNLILSVTNALPSTTYSFIFHVRDPASKTWNSTTISYTTAAGQTQFGIFPAYPSSFFAGNGRNDLLGQYVGSVDQTSPPVTSNPVATTPNGFWFILTDKTEYQRTEIIGFRASGYTSSENATVVIRTQTTSTVVLNVTIAASSTGLVTGSWKIPRNAILDNYAISITGKTTSKNPPDTQGFIVRAATMTIAALTASNPSYQRTETMQFSFKARYPDGQYASTGTALVNLTSTANRSVSLTATFFSASQTFNATYKTFPNNVTGSWTAALPVDRFDDGFGNTGPSTAVSTAPQLLPATLIINIISKSYFAVNEQIRFNATIQYPDLTSLPSSGSQVAAFVLFSGGGHNDTMSVFFDSTIGFWVGSYSPNNEPGGLWSLTVAGADSASPANSGKATKAIQLQDQLPVASFTFTSGTINPTQTVNFNATTSHDPDGTIVSYTWSFGDGSTGSGATRTHTYSVIGTYSVKLNVTDNSGSTAVSTSTLIVTARALTLSLTQSSTNPASGQAVTVTISALDPDGTITTTSVDWGDGTTDSIAGAATSDSHIYTLSSGTSKTFTVTVTIHDSNGAVKAATSNPITVGPAQSSNNVSFPLYYFGIIAAIIAALLVGAFLVLRRHKVTHARLKIDLEAVKAEAGRIENQDFFQSVKDQLKKDKEE